MGIPHLRFIFLFLKKEIDREHIGNMWFRHQERKKGLKKSESECMGISQLWELTWLHLLMTSHRKLISWIFLHHSFWQPSLSHLMMLMLSHTWYPDSAGLLLSLIVLGDLTNYAHPKLGWLAEVFISLWFWVACIQICFPCCK